LFPDYLNNFNYSVLVSNTFFIGSKQLFNKSSVVVKSTVPQIALIECIANCGIPISAVLLPSFPEKIGPIVIPHGDPV
jgi:hypothetical protein